MSEGANPHPGSWLGDLGNEWKTAKPPEKVVIVGAIVAVIGIALYLHSKSSASAPNQPGAAGNQYGIPANFQTGSAPGTVGTTPGGPGSPPGGTGGPGSTGGPGGPGSPPGGTGGPLIPLGQYKGPSYSNLKPGTAYTWGGVPYILKAGAGGRLWGINPQGQQVLLYGAPSAYPPSSTTLAQTYSNINHASSGSP